VKFGFGLIIFAVGVLALVSMFTVPPVINLASQTFDVSRYCSLYRKQFNVSHCPAETATAAKSTFLDLSLMSPLEIIVVSVAAFLMLIGVVMIMISRHVS
jgi:hypothetical protein